MKKNVAILLFLAMMCISSFAQTTTASTIRTGYFNKSKKQHTAAWIFLGGGAVFTVVGYTIGLNRVFHEIGSVLETGKDDNSFVAGTIIFFTGISSMLASVPLFIASSKNRKKGMALSVSLKIEKATVPQRFAITHLSYPAVSLRFNFN